MTNSERRISRQRPFLVPPGDARPDWWALAQVGVSLGYPTAFAYANPAEIFREHAALSGLAAAEGRDFDIAALAQFDYDAMPPVQWPVGGPARFFAEGGFFTPDQRGRMIAVDQVPVRKQAPGFPLSLNTGRIRDQWHTMTRTGRAARLGQHISEPFVEIHPEDAETRDIGPADLVEVSSPYGRVLVRAMITARVRPGAIFVPIHWSSACASRARVDALVPSAADPTSGQPALKMGRAQIRRHAAAWYAFAVSRRRPTPETDYWAIAPTPFGWRAEIADAAQPEDWEALAKALLAVPEAEVVRVDDRTRGLVRIALIEDGQITAAFFAGPAPVEVARAHVIAAFESDAPAMLLAGRPGAAQEDHGAIVCACFDVGVNTIADAISRGAVTSVESIGAVLRAGSNCGSCRPELKALLAAHTTQIAAE